ncbi:discoidin domain-containing protein [Segetibacter koreensis]|uniref:discoidin domain-containing protein n=1 Tax=Segetibacter koreensis TaxID=398037 RepID=UPI00035C840B|nr:discoidin domain-containing protein [Segetibacter koreensis]
MHERLGQPALNNIGYASNTASMFTNKSLKPLPPLPKDTDPVMGENLALHRPVSASNTRGNTTQFIPERALDGNPKTYWATNDKVTTATFELDMENPVDVNAVELAEVMELGPRIQAYKVEGQVNSDWKLLSQGTTVGARKVDKFPTETVWKVKITITKASGYVALKKVGLYLQK